MSEFRVPSSFGILCVTNRRLCSGDFLERIRKIAAARPAGIILREKDLTEEEYARLAREVLEICRAQGVRCILHSFVEIAADLRAEGIHLPLPLLLRTERKTLLKFSAVGASCHSREEARLAQAHGCTYLTAGHVFDTDCKKGLPGRGTDFLKEVCKEVFLPVYAIGGISRDNVDRVRATGAAGVCVMSGVMRCENVENYLLDIEARAKEKD